MSIITRSDNVGCQNPSSNLNYPSFIVFYNGNTSTKVETFQRHVTSVGRRAVVYKAVEGSPLDSIVVLSPETLAFGSTGETKSYAHAPTITFKADENKTPS